MRYPILTAAAILSSVLLTAPLAGQETATFIRVSEAQVLKMVKHKIAPEYPALARQVRLTGEVRVEAVFGPAGVAEAVQIVSGNSLLANSAVSAVKKWKLETAAVDGKPVRYVATLTFTFRL
ncbi:MAG: energy transducer TonB [Bryobacterales bacterium]|nr:energy transducer TonB [Bryobacterales bacterium]